MFFICSQFWVMFWARWQFKVSRLIYFKTLNNWCQWSQRELKLTSSLLIDATAWATAALCLKSAWQRWRQFHCRSSCVLYSTLNVPIDNRISRAGRSVRQITRLCTHLCCPWQVYWLLALLPLMASIKLTFYCCCCARQHVSPFAF